MTASRARDAGGPDSAATGHHVVVIEAALNGGRDRLKVAAVPYSPKELAAEAKRCADQGAAVVHLHARTDDGGWTADPSRYAETLALCRAEAPGVVLGITSIRPDGVPVEAVTDLLAELAADPATTPDLVSINLGHIVVWEPPAGPNGRRTVHVPNDYEDVVKLLETCRRLRIRPELGVMDLGFVSNAVALRDDGVLPAAPWFLLELDAAAWGAGPQVAPATVANYDALVSAMGQTFPDARWAAHGQGDGAYPVAERAIAAGHHVRVGFEDAIALPDGGPASSNAQLVAWAVRIASRFDRPVASPTEARGILGLPSGS